jgi:superfamily II DNA or RNA helicase/IS1 family transposase
MNGIHEMAFPLFVRKGKILKPGHNYINFLERGELGKVIESEMKQLLGRCFRNKKNIDELMVGLEKLIGVSGVNVRSLSTLHVDELPTLTVNKLAGILNATQKNKSHTAYDFIYFSLVSSGRLYTSILFPKEKKYFLISYGISDAVADKKVTEFISKLQSLGITVETYEFKINHALPKSFVWLRFLRIIYNLSNASMSIDSTITKQTESPPVLGYLEMDLFGKIVNECSDETTIIENFKSTGPVTNPEKAFVRFVYSWVAAKGSVNFYDTFHSGDKSANDLLKLLQTSKTKYLENFRMVEKEFNGESDLFSAIYKNLMSVEKMSRVERHELKYFRLYQLLSGKNDGNDLRELVDFVTNGKQVAATRNMSDDALEKWLISKYKVDDGNRCVVRNTSRAITPLCAKTLRCLPGTKSGGKLRDYQIDVLNKLWNSRGVLVAHGPGTGKTRTALLAIKCLSQKYIFANIFIVTPKAVLGQFIEDSKRCLTHPVESRITYLSHDDLLLGKHITGPNGLVGSILIIDEIHNFRNIKGSRTKQLVALCRSACRLVLLTGTPFVNEVDDLAIYNELLLEANERDSEKKQSKKRLDSDVVREKKELGLEWLGIDGKVSVYTSNQNSSEFPEVVHVDRKINVTDGKTISGYVEIANECRDVALVKSRQYLDYEIKYKFEEVMKILEERKQEIKKFSKEKLGGIVIYMPFLKGIKLFQEKLRDRGYEVRNIQGATSKKEIDRTISLFNEGVVDVLMISDAGTEGINLKKTWGIVFASGTFHNSARTQIIGRGVRFLSHESLPKNLQRVYVYDLIITMGNCQAASVITADEKMFDFTHRKATECENVMSLLSKM